MLLYEILNTKVKSHAWADPGVYTTVAKIGDRTIYFSAGREGQKQDNVWEFNFLKLNVEV